MRKRSLMKWLAVAFALGLIMQPLTAQESAGEANQSSANAAVEKPVLDQLRGYNKRDIEEFLSAYSDDVRVYAFPDTLRYQGKEKMRERYANYFQSLDNLHCEVVSRMIQGNVVIDNERVTRSIGGVESVVKAIAIYTIKDGKIVEVRFVQ